LRRSIDVPRVRRRAFGLRSCRSPKAVAH